MFLILQTMLISLFCQPHENCEAGRLYLIISITSSSERPTEPIRGENSTPWEQTSLFHYCLSLMLWVRVYEVREELKNEKKKICSSNRMIILKIISWEGTQCLLSKGENSYFKNNFPGLFKEQCVNTGRTSQNYCKVCTKKTRNKYPTMFYCSYGEWLVE